MWSEVVDDGLGGLEVGDVEGDVEGGTGFFLESCGHVGSFLEWVDG